MFCCTQPHFMAVAVIQTHLIFFKTKSRINLRTLSLLWRHWNDLIHPLRHSFPQHPLTSPPLRHRLFSWGWQKAPWSKPRLVHPPEWWSDAKNQTLSNTFWALCLVFVSNLAFCTILPVLAFLGWPNMPRRLFEKYSKTGSLQRLVFILFNGFSGCSVSLCFCHRKCMRNRVVPNPGSDCKSFKMICWKLTALKS